MTPETETVPVAKAEGKAKKTVQGKAFDRKLFARVFAFTGPYRGIFRWTVFLTIVLSIVGVVRPIMLGWLIDVAATDYNALFELNANSNWNARSVCC